MTTQSLQVRLDPHLKKQAELVLEALGIDLPSAIRIFLKKVVTSRSIPFELKANFTVNGFTPEFEAQVLEASKDPELIGPFDSLEL